MKFAFLIHPLSDETATLLDFDTDGLLQQSWGVDPLGVCAHLHNAVQQAQHNPDSDLVPQPRVVDELSGLTLPLGGSAEGRLYEIPMSAAAILMDPSRAMTLIEQAAQMAVDWGAKVIGLGSMTGIVGGHGTYLAEHCSAAVTTGNSLTVFGALQNFYHAVEELDFDLSRETVAVVGIPGSIASALAQVIAPQCGELLLVARRSSTRSSQLSEQLGAELLLDIEQALGRARVVISATSSGSCIDQLSLQPGSVVVDVAVPTDVQGVEPLRDDVLILTGGLAQLPQSMPYSSKFLWFHHGTIPSCLAETMVLALGEREESLSLGRNLNLEAVQEIGAVARSYGLEFSQFYSFGHPLDESRLIRFYKSAGRRGPRRLRKSPTPKQLADRAPTLHARHVNPVLMAVGKSSDFVKTFVRGEAEYLFDAEGNRYLDFVAGFGSMNLGHNHPAIVEAVSEALQCQAPGFAQSAVNPYAASLAEEIVLLAPTNLEMVFFANSGTEAVEAALKLARTATGRSGLLYCERSFHGKSMGSLSVTGNPDYQRPFGPLLPECESIPFGDYDALDRALTTRRFAAFIVEPIQAEGGMVVPQAGYLREAQALCRATDTLLVVDEVQTGLGRTGSLFAVEHEGVNPDLMTLAKSLGGGLMPIGALLTRRDLWLKAYGTVETFALHTSTFGGGSLACAAGLAALRTICDEDLAANAEARGRQLSEGLAEFCRRDQCLREVHGRGLLLGLEFEPLPSRTKAHWKAMDRTGMSSYLVPGLDKMIDSLPVMYTIQSLLQSHRIYTQVARSNPLVLRIQPPLTVNEEQVNQFLDALGQTCQEFDYAVSLTDHVIAKTGLGQHDAKMGLR